MTADARGLELGAKVGDDLRRDIAQAIEARRGSM